jgi:protein TonB
MSKFSIYSKAWIEQVFQDKNQDYGAFQLRQKSDETTLLAFCLGLTVVATILTIPMFMSSFNSQSPAQLSDPIHNSPVIRLANYPATPPKAPKKMAVPISQKSTTSSENQQSLANPQVVNARELTTETETKTTAKNCESSANSTQASAENNTNIGQTTSERLGSNVANEEELINTTLSVDKLPEFPGGLNAFYSYVGNKFESVDVEETKTVYLSFIIEKDGSINDVKVIRSASPTIDKEAIRVLQSLRTKWKPGVKNGQPVRTLYRLPITIKKI